MWDIQPLCSVKSAYYISILLALPKIILGHNIFVYILVSKAVLLLQLYCAYSYLFV